MAEVRHHLGPHVLDEERDGGQDEHRGQDAQLMKKTCYVKFYRGIWDFS